MATHLLTELEFEAFEMALQAASIDGCHPPLQQGRQFTSIASGQHCKRAGVRPSMGSVGDSYDNAMCETSFVTGECDLIDRTAWSTRTEARMDVFSYTEGFYNLKRLHSALGYLSPIAFERRGREVDVPAECGVTCAGCFPLRGHQPAACTPSVVVNADRVTEIQSLTTEGGSSTKGASCRLPLCQVRRWNQSTTSDKVPLPFVAVNRIVFAAFGLRTFGEMTS